MCPMICLFQEGRDLVEFSKVPELTSSQQQNQTKTTTIKNCATTSNQADIEKYYYFRLFSERKLWKARDILMGLVLINFC